MGKRQFDDEYASQIVSSLIGCYERLKQFEQAEAVRRQWLSLVKERSGADSLSYAGELASLGRNLLAQQRWTEAEATIRDCLAIRRKKLADDWSTFNTQSMLGAALLGQNRGAEAGPLLLEAYQGMKERAEKIPWRTRALRLASAAERLVQLFEALDKKDEAARWRKELEAIKKR